MGWSTRLEPTLKTCSAPVKPRPGTVGVVQLLQKDHEVDVVGAWALDGPRDGMDQDLTTVKSVAQFSVWCDVTGQKRTRRPRDVRSASGALFN